jgi:hypothetical protein
VLPRIVVTQERIARWRATAEQMDMSLESWIIRNLDSAASIAQLSTGSSENIADA